MLNLPINKHPSNAICPKLFLLEHTLSFQRETCRWTISHPVHEFLHEHSPSCCEQIIPFPTIMGQDSIYLNYLIFLVRTHLWKLTDPFLTTFIRNGLILRPWFESRALFLVVDNKLSLDHYWSDGAKCGMAGFLSVFFSRSWKDAMCGQYWNTVLHTIRVIMTGLRISYKNTWHSCWEILSWCHH